MAKKNILASEKLRMSRTTASYDMWDFNIENLRVIISEFDSLQVAGKEPLLILNTGDDGEIYGVHIDYTDLETDEEFARRLEYEEKDRTERQAFKEKHQKSERKLYERLKKKYEKC